MRGFYYLFTLFLFNTLLAFSQTDQTNFHAISIADNLSQSTVRIVFQDSKGFMWFGTKGGLNKYDGNKFITYKKNNIGHYGLSSNDIKAVDEDSQGKLWIATWEGGVNVLDPKTQRFTHYRNRGKKVLKLSSDFIECILIDSKDNAWIGTATNGIDFLDRKNNRIKHYTFLRTDSLSISSNNISAIYEDSKKNVWIGTSNGLNLFNKTTHQFKRFLNDPGNKNSLSNNKVKFIFEDKRKNLWIGTYGGGLNLFNPKTQSFKPVPLLGLKSNVLLSISEDNKGNLWIGTENNGLIKFNPEKQTIKLFQNIEHDNNSISSNTINSIIKDIKGDIWLGTSNGGVNLINTDLGKFNHYRHQEGQNSLRNNTVNSIYEDADGYIWLGTDGGGIDKFDRKTRKFKNYSNVKNQTNSIAHDVITTICQDDKNAMWIGTWGEGITVFNPKTNQYRHYKNDPRNSESISNNYILFIFKDKNNSMWIGTYGGGLNLYDPVKEIFIHYQNDINKTTSLSNNYILTINEDSAGNLLVGTDGGGLNIMDKKTGMFINYKHTDELNTISNNSVNTIWEEKGGELWIGTNHGLNKLNRKTGQVKSYFIQQGLTNDIVTAILGDKSNNLWISTKKGLSKFNTLTNTFKNYTVTDGLQASEFRAARCLSTNEIMYFGGINGFNEFNPAKVIDHPYTPPLLFTGFEIFNKEVPVQPSRKEGYFLNEHINTIKEIVLSYEASVITFEFASLNYVDKEKKQYAYMLEGFDKEWHHIGTKNNITYTNLDPGAYLLKVKTLNNGGEWSTQEAEIKLVITPPFWKTWWFITLIILLIIGTIVFIFYQRLHAIRQRNKQLENEVSKRTLQLKETNSNLLESYNQIKLQNETLADYNDEIQNKSEEILMQQEHILLQNNELEKVIEKLESSNHTKDRFFSILAHDLKNPVSALSGLTSLLKNKFESLSQQELRNYLTDLNNSSNSIHTLLVNLLDWVGSQSETIKSNPGNLNVYELIIKTNSLIEQQLKNKNIKFSIDTDPSHYVYADSQMINTIIRNILFNSIKFTHSSGEISIRSIATENEIVLVFTDTGIGMTQEQTETLFDNNEKNIATGTQGERGIGLGLVVAKDFLKANNGSIAVKSAVGKGSEFTIRLPRAIKNDYEEVDQEHTFDGKFPALPFKDEKTILIVDDNKEIRAYLRLLLADTFTVIEAENGKDGKKMAAELQPNIIISDMLMPVMDGLEFCQSLKGDASTSHIPVILLTSQSNELSQLSGYEAGADIYLSKSLNRNILFSVIYNFIKKQDNIREKFIESEDLYPKDLPIGDIDKEFLEKIAKYVEEHLSNPELDHRKIIELTAMSRTILYAKFKSLTGQGVHGFIKSARLKKASRLLLEGQLNINQVSYEVGFNTPSYFTKSFISYYGVSPSEYISKNKKVTVR